MPVDAFLESLGKQLDIKVLDTSVMECEALVLSGKFTDRELHRLAKAVIMQTFIVVDVRKVAQIAVKDYDEEEEPLVMSSEILDLDESFFGEQPMVPAPEVDPVVVLTLYKM